MTSRRLSKERSNGDAESAGILGGEISAQLGGASLDAPDLDAGRPEFVGKLLPTQLLGFPDLLNPLSDRGDVTRSHGIVVSETETLVESFQTRKRKTALSLTPMEPPPTLTMEDFERWAEQADEKFANVLKRADVSNPDDARASRARMRTPGGAPRVRKNLYAVLMEIEKKRDRPTKMGEAMIQLEKLREIGVKLARVAPGALADLVVSAEKRLAIAEADDKSTEPFGNLK